MSKMSKMALNRRRAGPPSDKRDTDKDEVEADDLHNDDCVELMKISGVKYWVSAKTKAVYRYSAGSEKVPKNGLFTQQYKTRKVGYLKKAEESVLGTIVCGSEQVQQLRVSGGHITSDSDN